MRIRDYIPNQHGAWAMLLVPFLFGMLASTPGAIHALLFACWLLIYLFMFPLLQWIRLGKAKAAARYRKPLLLYGALLVPAALILVLLRPEVLSMALLFVPLFAVNALYAKRKRERALLNDIAAIVQFSLMVLISYKLGGGTDLRLAAELFLISTLYFIGTAFYVKTIIRERNNKRFYFYSVAYHGMLMLLALWLLSPAMQIAALILLARAVWFPRTGITAKQSGMLEIVYSVIVLAAVWMTYA
ncbi:MAG: YwiC-like family protein [Paenibacillus sp.]|uniref:YwiC-like family protein n=1 Tax=Paenibacillus sp. TaxID=58172 RepID=UPI002911D5F0|nr:YwiC-like family protein [Paenibacillus sp.]MDU4696428.1 YwiC-like family protein [Paenibacillus sp.]